MRIDELTLKIDRLLDPVFEELQKEKGIKYGDVDPIQAFELEEIEEKLARKILEIIANQAKYNR